MMLHENPQRRQAVDPVVDGMTKQLLPQVGNTAEDGIRRSWSQIGHIEMVAGRLAATPGTMLPEDSVHEAVSAPQGRIQQACAVNPDAFSQT